MKKYVWFAIFAIFFNIADTKSQSLISGRIVLERFAGSNQQFPFSAVYCIACADANTLITEESQPSVSKNKDRQEPFSPALWNYREPRIFRSWETDPSGWFRLSCEAGNHTLLFTHPASFMRPVLWKNVYLNPDEEITDFRVKPLFDMFCAYEAEWDSPAGNGYYQVFTAKSKSLTHVGFKFAHDGVDGQGPGKQDFLVSIHLKSDEPPQKWEQVGPTAVIPDVDAGGVKNYSYYAGWNSGEVKLTPGRQYAVFIRPKDPNGRFQPFWRPTTNASEFVYKVTNEKCEIKERQLWIAIGGDCDGLVIPYNKKVHKQFGEFAGFSSKWAQTFVAQGEGLAGVVIYAAVGGAQPPLSRQRLKITVHKNSPDGEVVGISKIAAGNGNYTGDASWGIFGTVFAPGEVPLEKGKTYAIVFETMETKETIGNFVNIKGDRSDGRAGFNPYKKQPLDDYPHGTAFLNGSVEMNFDLDMQIVEYEKDYANDNLILKNLIKNGDFQSGIEVGNTQEILAQAVIPPRGSSGFIKYNLAYKNEPAEWKVFKLTDSTKVATFIELPHNTNCVARIYGEPGSEIDGVIVQRVDGLTRHDTYVMQCRTRSSWALDKEHRTMIGFDSTGQDSDVNAKTIVWTNLPPMHSVFFNFQSQPIRPKSSSISIWLRGKSTFKGDTFAPFYADFDDAKLFQVKRELSGVE